jgi:hypothetical protein
MSLLGVKPLKEKGFIFDRIHKIATREAQGKGKPKGGNLPKELSG